MLLNGPPQLRPLSSLPLLWALAGPNSSTARRGGAGGASTHHWDPLEGLPAQAPTYVVLIVSEMLGR
jgi:hypothetical protein